MITAGCDQVWSVLLVTTPSCGVELSSATLHHPAQGVDQHLVTTSYLSGCTYSLTWRNSHGFQRQHYGIIQSCAVHQFVYLCLKHKSALKNSIIVLVLTRTIIHSNREEKEKKGGNGEVVNGILWNYELFYQKFPFRVTGRGQWSPWHSIMSFWPLPSPHNAWVALLLEEQNSPWPMG